MGLAAVVGECLWRAEEAVVTWSATRRAKVPESSKTMVTSSLATQPHRDSPTQYPHESAIIQFDKENDGKLEKKIIINHS